MRIGIHLGEIDRRGDDVSGLAVNTAARIMSSAEPGQILASAVGAQTASVTTFTALGPRALKGLDGVWEIFATD